LQDLFHNSHRLYRTPSSPQYCLSENKSQSMHAVDPDLSLQTGRPGNFHLYRPVARLYQPALKRCFRAHIW